jgi:hypothetical protein
MAKRTHDLRSGRPWIGVEVNLVLVGWRALPRDLVGHWLTLFAYSASQNGGGRIRWPDRKTRRELRSLGTEPRDIERLVRHGLARRTGKYLEIVGYDIEREERFLAASDQGRALAYKRWGKRAPTVPGDADRNERGDADQRRGEKNRDPPKAPQGGHDICGDEPNGFREFWAALPGFLQQARSNAVREWLRMRLDRDEVTRQRILKALERQKRSERWLEGNRKLNLTSKMYLRRRRWEDGPDPAGERTAGSTKGAKHPPKSRDTPEEIEARFQVDWEADPANVGKPYPGREAVLAQMVREREEALAQRGNTQ